MSITIQDQCTGRARVRRTNQGDHCAVTAVTCEPEDATVSVAFGSDGEQVEPPFEWAAGAELALTIEPADDAPCPFTITIETDEAIDDADARDSSEPPATLDDYTIDEARELIEAVDDRTQLEAWAEHDSRRGIDELIDRRLSELDEDNDESE